jgi:hypothetical protein
MLAIFWDVNGVEHSEFMATGTITNYEHYVGTLQKLKAQYAAGFPPTQQCEASHEYMKNCRDSPPRFQCLEPPTIQSKCGSI